MIVAMLGLLALSVITFFIMSQVVFPLLGNDPLFPIFLGHSQDRDNAGLPHGCC